MSVHNPGLNNTEAATVVTNGSEFTNELASTATVAKRRENKHFITHKGESGKATDIDTLSAPGTFLLVNHRNKGGYLGLCHHPGIKEKVKIGFLDITVEQVEILYQTAVLQTEGKVGSNGCLPGASLATGYTDYHWVSAES